MNKLFATIYKELLLIRRDRAGLLVLFVMPAVLVLIITLVQENVLKTIGESNIKILFVDKDLQAVGEAIEKKLLDSGSVEIIKTLNGRQIEEKAALEAIVGGDYQLCIVVPEGITKAVRLNAREAVEASLFRNQKKPENSGDIPALDVYFDPAVLGGFRSAVRSSLELVVFGIEVREKLNALSELLPEYVVKNIRKSLGPAATEGLTVQAPQVKLDWSPTRVLEIREKVASPKFFKSTPTSVQQNVPAWSLFGIFFIVLPMAGTLIKERLDGTSLRLMSMPVSYITIISGKVLAYAMICVAQFGLILFIGKVLLPILGTPQLYMGTDPFALVVVALSAILAATGYGVMLGTIVRTYEQASMFGPISVVIAAAIGGIMVPVYAMPKLMQQISMLSPLGWGLNAFLDLFVRGGNISSILPEVFSLLGFFFCTLLVSCIVFIRRGKTGP
jgi:ABC-2 type transport system permease protein